MTRSKGLWRSSGRSHSHRLGRAGVVAIVSICAFGCTPLTPGASAAVAYQPAWGLTQSTVPTYLPPGASAGEPAVAAGGVPKYVVTATNIGSAPAPAGATITDTLPAGIEVSGDPEVEFVHENGFTEPEKCSHSGQVVSCVVPLETGPQRQITVFIPITVQAGEGDVVANIATVAAPGMESISSTGPALVSAASPSFGFASGPDGVRGSAVDFSGRAASAGSHPAVVTLFADFPTAPTTLPTERLRSLSFDLPAGLAVNPTATGALCDEINFTKEQCPVASQVGSIYVRQFGYFQIPSALYNLVPRRGVPAELGFGLFGTRARMQGHLTGTYQLGAGATEIVSSKGITGITAELWGDPSDPSHDSFREGLNPESGQPSGQCPRGGCSVEPATSAFLTIPSACGPSLAFDGSATSWPGSTAARREIFSTGEGEPEPVEGCNQLAFEPTIAAQATTNVAETSSGLDFSVHQPQNESPDGRSTAALKDATVSLPEGMSLNPAAANGLDSCTEGQMGYAPEGSKIRFETTPQSCPSAAKIGNLEVTTPLLDHKLPGAIYVAKAYQNPFGSLLAIYLAVEDEESGVVAKLAGKVEPDPVTGQLTTTFTENPQLPIEDIALHFFNGARGVLTTPLTCGTHVTTSTLTPWSTPEGVDVHPAGSFETQVGCSASEAAAPKTVSFTAGTVSPLSGAYSPFTLRISRKDGTQHITGVETLLPEGLIGKAAGIPYCSDAEIALARSREAPEMGKKEQASSSCPAASEVGTVQVTAGSGITPIPVSGHVFWAGPYKGAPLSVVAIVPAVAGPFDLGTVVDRVALYVGEYDARIHAVADPLPTIKDGIPLDVRSIELKLDRPGFTLNPTSCEAMAIEGSVSTQTGQHAALNNHFQVGECGRLAFKPKLKLSLKGSTQRGKNPALTAVLTQPAGQANIDNVAATLPRSEFIDNRHINSPCTRVQFNAGTGNGAECPAKSILGYAKAYTPLLDRPLEGPVYFRSNGGERELPDLVASLGGQIHVNLVGFIDSVGKKGSEVARVRNTFATVPDAPVSRFVLQLKGGKNGLLQNSANLCKVENVATVKLDAQNGRLAELKPKVANSCGKSGGKKKKSRGHKAGKGKR
jgi:uncharacterized repeat protein (TIGR01451 family)